MQDALEQAGLTSLQAGAYLYLLDNGESAPPALAQHLQMSRTNAYKVLDSLSTLGLVNRREARKKIVFQAADPSALSQLVAEKRIALLALERSVSDAMQELRRAYQKHNASTVVSTRYGKQRMLEAYQTQADLAQPVYLVKARSDIPFMGFETMAKIRRLSNYYQMKRYGLTPDSSEAAINPALDVRTNFIRTWMPADSYTAPVEWTVSGDLLLIQVFDGAGRVISIKDSVVADAFRQLWTVMDANLRQNPEYKNLPRLAKRKV